jgi:nucleoside-diphosphate-sugar epimerase
VTDGISGARIVVTGSAGLIGRRTALLLRDQGNDVVAFDRVPSGIDGAVEVVSDLRDSAGLRTAVAGADAVVHLGGIAGPELADDVTTYEINAVGTYSVFSAAAAAGVRKIVYASSINASGLPLGKLRHPSTLPYGEDEPSAISDS